MDFMVSLFYPPPFRITNLSPKRHEFCDQKTQLGGTLFQAGPRNAPGALELFASPLVSVQKVTAGEIYEKPQGFDGLLKSTKI